MSLSGEGEFNLNSLKEIEVTDSFLELDSDVIKCQNYEGKNSYDNCTTSYLSEQMRMNCGCLPLKINNATTNKVCKCLAPKKAQGVILTSLSPKSKVRIKNLGKKVFELSHYNHACFFFKISICSSNEELKCVETTIKRSKTRKCLR